MVQVVLQVGDIIFYDIVFLQYLGDIFLYYLGDIFLRYLGYIIFALFRRYYFD